METALQRIQLAKENNATYLYFSNIGLCNLPVELFKLSSLTCLNLSDNQLIAISKEIGQLSSLTTLDLHKNNLVYIPKEISQLSSLTSLNLSNNELVNIPEEIGQLSALTTLDLHKNKLFNIPEEISQLSSLTILYLSGNQLITITKAIGQLKSLTKLHLWCNQLLDIPKEIGQLSSLTELYLGNNQLLSIPKEISQLSSLTHLSLNNNQLLAIPKEIGQLSSLTELYLNYNQLISLPIELIQLRQARIKYSNNPIEYIPPNLLRFLQRDRIDYQKVYSDGQNVHNHSIQDSISGCIHFIMTHKPIIKTEQLSDFIIQNKYLSEPTKQLLFEYSDNPDLHSRFGLSFSELLLNILSLIEDQHQENKEAIYSILNQEMTDSQCKCFTGRISRLVNCLNGFDPNIIIQISNSEQIGNIIGLIHRQLEDNGTYSIRNHQDLVRKELIERGYDNKTIKEWVNAITV
jgi:leucine-rich repeat protein SHOC2